MTTPRPLHDQQMVLTGFDEPAPLAADEARRALDDLVHLARLYASSRDYMDLMEFMARFRMYAPYNAMLIHSQMPGAQFVAPPARWLREYGRHIRPGSRPLVILQRMGPVMFVFDVSQTEAEPDAPELPKSVTEPFAVTGRPMGGEYERTVANAQRDGIAVILHEAGSQHAGMIRPSSAQTALVITVRMRPKQEQVSIPVRYEVLLNQQHEVAVRYASLVHELAHLYCGHLGTPNEKWWPDRHRVALDVREFEAESVSYLVCRRLGIDTPSAEYLSGYADQHEDAPAISLECVLKAAGLIEQMGRSRLPLRKDSA